MYWVEDIFFVLYIEVVGFKYTVSRKKCAKLFLSELRQISTYLHGLREYKTGNIPKTVERRAKVTIKGLYKVVQGLFIAAEIYDLEQTLSEIQGHLIP